MLHNIFYAGFAFVAGWLADHFDKRALLACGYGLAAAMGLLLVLLPITLPLLVVVFVVAGIYVAGDFLSSIVVGALWTVFGPPAAFAYSTVLFIARLKR
ncbi:MAG: hypothetical protein V1929_05035 [bacterium]